MLSAGGNKSQLHLLDAVTLQKCECEELCGKSNDLKISISLGLLNETKPFLKDLRQTDCDNLRGNMHDSC